MRRLASLSLGQPFPQGPSSLVRALRKNLSRLLDGAPRRSLSGFLGDNWSWYRESEPDVDWFRVKLKTNHEYTIELWTEESYPQAHQATDLKILGIYDANGDLIPDTPSSTSGKKVIITFEPASDGEYYIAVGSGQRDRTGVYRIGIRGRSLA